MFSRGVEASAEQTSSQNKFVTSAELEAAARYYERADARLEAAEKLTNSIDILAKEGFDAAFKKYPYLNQEGEAGDTQAKKDKCLRDIKHYLRLISYCLVVGGTGPLDEWGIAGAREVYRSLDIPTAPYVAAFQFVKDSICSLLDVSSQATAELVFYLDYLINDLS